MNVNTGGNLERGALHVYIGMDLMWKWLVDLGLVKLRNTARSSTVQEFSSWRFLLNIMIVFSEMLSLKSIEF